ncbi:unnamed protein product [Closterium sp. NIES-65]|nr:unnamed protein product [Closterium sp. NIES-65]
MSQHRPVPVAPRPVPVAPCPFPVALRIVASRPLTVASLSPSVSSPPVPPFPSHSRPVASPVASRPLTVAVRIRPTRCHACLAALPPVPSRPPETAA